MREKFVEDKLYWIWLQQALDYGSHKIYSVHKLYSNIKNFFEAGEKEWRLSGLFSNKEINALCSTHLKTAYDILENCNRLSYQVVTLNDPEYPNLLLNISNPPAVIYVSGDISYLNESVTVAVVGTRHASIYGMSMADEIGYKLAERGIVVISGAAMGIDSAAHRGALKAKGKTIAVLGCGINYNYLMRNLKLRQQISETGALISEYPPDYAAFNSNFPIRNRIISGLSLGTIIVEAGKRSGSLITANLANEQGRDVFVVPVDMRTPLSAGIVSLIEDGVPVIENVESVINEYENRYKIGKRIVKEDKRDPDSSSPFLYNNIKIEKSSINIKENITNPKAELPELTDSAKMVYEILLGGKMNVNDMSVKLNLEINKLLAALTELEIYKLVKVHSGRMYEINR